MKFLKSQLGLLLPLLLIVFYFLKGIHPITAYIYISLTYITIIYFFPVRFLLHLKGKKKKKIWILLLVNIFFASATIAATIVAPLSSLYLKYYVIIHIVVAILGAILYYNKSKVSDNFLICLLFAILLSCSLIF